jgi:hypothetical protein
MAMRSKKKKTVKMKMNKEISRQIKNLETDLKLTIRAIDGKYESLDQIFTSQAQRIRAQIDKLKGNQ